MRLKALFTVTISLLASNYALSQKFDQQMFDLLLRGQHVELPSKSIKDKNIASKRADVWKKWKKAVVRHYGLQLDESLLSSSKEYSWQLVDEDPLPFVFVKKDERPTNGYPLFINLHGSGPKSQEWSASKQLSKGYKGGPSLYFVPQIPSEKRYRWGLIPMQQAYEKLLRLAMVSDQIDWNKMYVMGISEGGYGSQRLGAFYADYWAGVGPMAGGEPLENAPVLNFRNTAFAMETGEFDTGFGRDNYTQQAKMAFKEMKENFPADFEHRVNFQAGRGHSINYNLVSPWLIEQVRKPLPHHVSWVNFPLYGRYREGFYNLAVEEPFAVHPDSTVDRTSFDLKMDAARNELVLTAHAIDRKSGEAFTLKSGKLAIYLSEKQMDLSKPVTLTVNGKEVFSGRLKLDEANLWRSCLLFGDPDRLFPAKILVDFSKF